MTNIDQEWWLKVNDALAVGECLTSTVGDLNEACEHIVCLLSDSSLLLESKSHASSVFLSITALEEIAKIHVGMYRRALQPAKRSKDPLYNHKSKHFLVASPTVSMGSRLQEAVGESRMNELLESARSGELVDVRESALYVSRASGGIKIPKKVISESYGREILLLAVEAFDDAFVGYTNYTYELSEVTDHIFDKWKAGKG